MNVAVNETRKDSNSSSIYNFRTFWYRNAGIPDILYHTVLYDNHLTADKIITVKDFACFDVDHLCTYRDYAKNMRVYIRNPARMNANLLSHIRQSSSFFEILPDS